MSTTPLLATYYTRGRACSADNAFRDELAIVKFSTSSADYPYWVSIAWGVKVGDHLFVNTGSHVGDRPNKTVIITEMRSANSTCLQFKRAVGIAARASERLTNFDPLTPEQRESWSTTDNTTFALLPKQDTTMIKIKHTTFIDDNPIETHNDDQLIEKISKAENELQRLNTIEHKPIALRKKIEELQSGIDFIVKYMDAKEALTPPTGTVAIVDKR